MRENEHSLIIAAKAKAALAPIGFRRKGRSRIWLADHGYWLGVVEFQPSGFSRGTYCNVSVHWLWGLVQALTFDFGFRRVGSYATFSEVSYGEFKRVSAAEQVVRTEAFVASVKEMAWQAAQVSEHFRRELHSLGAAAALLIEDQESAARVGRPDDWGAFHAGVACGLIGDLQTAECMLRQLLPTEASAPMFVVERAAAARRILDVVDQPPVFAALVQDLIDSQRTLFKLPPYQLVT